MAHDAPRTIGGYVIEGELGRGGMGAVYRARHPRLPGRQLALKVLLDAGADDPETLGRFQREMHALAKIPEHRNVVRIFAGSAEGSQPFFVMEYVDGPSLAKRVQAGALDPREAVRIVLEVARGVAHMHAHGIVHRDLKPQNVFLSSDGRVLVGDFGLARVAGEQRLTRTQASFGTPGYSAPEQLDGRAVRADRRADVFALGATLWFTLVGRAPFSGDSPVKVLLATLEGDVSAPSEERSDVPAELDAICRHALEKEPHARYATADAFAADLEHFLAGEPVAAMEAARRKQRRRLLRRLRRLALVLVLIGIAAAGAWRWNRARQARTQRVDVPLARALETKRDALALAETLAAIETEGATPDELSKLRRHVADVARAEAGDAGASSDFVRVRQRLLERLGLSPGEVAALDAPLARALGREVERALSKGPLDRAVVTELAAKARAAAGSLDLVGEQPGDGPPVGALLVDAAGRPEVADVASVALAAAQALVSQRLGARGDDPAGLALEAAVALALAKAPVVPLGPGRVATVASRDARVRAGLEAGAQVPGAWGERAAWLRLDLVLEDPASSAELIRAALARARERGGADSPERAALEELVTLEPAAPGLGTLLAEDRWKKDPRLATLALARFLSRCGAPSAVDGPDVAAGLVAPKAAAAREDLEAYYPVVVPSSEKIDHEGRVEVGKLEDELFGPANELRDGAHADPLAASSEAVHDAIRLPFRKNAARLTAKLAEILRTWPEDGSGLLWASDQHRELFSAAPIKVLADRAVNDETPGVAEMFSPEDRSLLEGNKVSTSFFEAAWELGGKRGEAAVLEFERLVERDTTGGGDPAAAALLEAPASREQLRRACEVAVALKALEELTPTEGRSPLPADESLRLALRAARGFESWVALGGPQVLGFRARWRRLVVPGPAGSRLATLDLARQARALALGAMRPAVLAADNVPFAGATAIEGACEAAETEGAADLARYLLRLGVALRYERVMVLMRRTGDTVEAKLDALRGSALADSKEKIGFSARAQKLRELLGWQVELSAKAGAIFDLPPDARARLVAKTYELPASWPPSDAPGR